MSDAAGMSEDLELIDEARAEYSARMGALQGLRGEEARAAADALEAWVDDVNRDLNDAAWEILGDGLAVNAESLAMWRMTLDTDEHMPAAHEGAGDTELAKRE